MSNLTGKIHSFESFGTVDGPGIRFVVFMQGCALKCKYCHNRDTWDSSSGTEYDVDYVFNQIMRSKTYFENSHGGVTISGGEPLLQAEFIIELFKKLKKKNIHTAIDTSGCLKINDSIKELLSYTDLVLLDIKHINNEKCIDLTGVSNKNTLDFAKYLSQNNIPVWIRHVLVPGITDNDKDLYELKAFINSLSNIEKVELLPYHDMGKYKWDEYNQEYPLKDTPIPSQEQILKAKLILEI